MNLWQQVVEELCETWAKDGLITRYGLLTCTGRYKYGQRGTDTVDAYRNLLTRAGYLTTGGKAARGYYMMLKQVPKGLTYRQCLLEATNK